MSLTQVKLCRYLITCSLCSWSIEESLSLLRSWIQIPFSARSVQVQDCSDIVLQDNIHVETTGDQTAGLEQIIVVLDPSVLRCSFFWRRKSAILINPVRL